MHRSFIAAAVAALVGTTVAQTAEFVNMTFGPVTVGSLWPITWSEGNGQAVSLTLFNATWNYTVFGKSNPGPASKAMLTFRSQRARDSRPV